MPIFAQQPIDDAQRPPAPPIAAPIFAQPQMPDDAQAYPNEGGPGAMVMNAIHSLFSLPQRAIENSQYSLDSGTYDPSVPMEAAMTAMGGGLGGAPVRAGETVLGAGPFRKLTGPAESDSNYVYHATNMDRAHDIAEEGLKRHKPGDFTDQDVWPDGSREKRNYATPTAQNTWQFAPEGGTPTLLRIRKDAHPFKNESGTGDLYSTKDIPPEAIEYQHDDGRWLPITGERK